MRPAVTIDKSTWIPFFPAMMTIAIDDAQRRFLPLCHELAESGEVCVILENGKPLVQITPSQPLMVEDGASPVGVIEALHAWAQQHPDEMDQDAEFVETWTMRTAGWRDPLDED